MHPALESIEVIDTLLAGVEGATSAYLVRGERPAIVDVGSQTSAQTVREALTRAGLGPSDLAWIVLTHIHLDHCGATGDLAAAFPDATVVVHRRGARHLAEPDRLVAATAAVHGPRAGLYGGLAPTPAERIVAAEDGHRVDLGGGRELVLHETPGHARHHMAIQDLGTGFLMSGDVVGVRFGEGGFYPAMPPSDIDIAGWRGSLGRIRALAPTGIGVAHFGPVPDVNGALEAVEELVTRAGEISAAAWPRGGRDAIAAALERELPMAAAVVDPVAVAHWERFGWHEANPDGLAPWAEAQVQDSPRP